MKTKVQTYCNAARAVLGSLPNWVILVVSGFEVLTWFNGLVRLAALLSS